MAVARSRLLGAAIAVAIGCLFLLMVVVTDYFDLLVNPREQLVLAAHPHDDRSILLAKLWVVGRSLAILFTFLCLPATIAVAAADGSVLSAVCYLGGAAGASLMVTTAGLYAGVAILTVFGREGFNRIMPWLQVSFQLSYFLFVGGGKLVRSIGSTASAALPSLLAWGFPPIWFLAPLEALHEGGWTATTAGRAALAAAALFALLFGGSAWLGARVGERLLEPIERAPQILFSGKRRAPRPVATERGLRGKGLRRVFGSPEGGRLFDLLRIHLRSDWRTRSEFFMGPVICGVLLLTSYRDASRWMGFFFVGLFLLASMDVLTRSARPELLWAILVTPLDRARFSIAAVSLMRVFQLFPTLAVFAAAGWRSAGRTLGERAFFLFELALYGDLLLLVGRGLFPEFPFSRPARTEGSAGGRRMVVMLASGLGSGVGTAILFLLTRQGAGGSAAALALLVLARFPASSWMHRRVSQAAESVELEPASAA